MESIARYIPHESKKRVFSDPEVVEIAPPPVSVRAAKPRDKGKQKVGSHEIIDVDMDDGNDVVILERKVESRKGTRGNMGISLGPSSSAKLDSKTVASNKKGKETPVGPSHFSNGFNPGSNNFFDLDDYVYDDDDYWALQSHFDSIGLPTGIEAPIPWSSGSAPTKKPNPAIPFVTSNAKSKASVSQPNRVNPLPKPTWFPPSKFNKAVGGKPTYFDPKHIPAQTVHSNFEPFGSHNGFGSSNSSNTQVKNKTSSFPQTAYPLGIDATNPEWYKPFMNDHMKLDAYYGSAASGMLPGVGGIHSMNDMLLGKDATVNGPSSSVAKFLDGDVKKRYESFKKFDTVLDHSDHYYAKQNPAMEQPPKNWAKRIQDEWRSLEKDLPDTIFVRVYESRMDLLRAVIIGAEGTPYHDGLFFFDVCFPSSYPHTPPLVNYHSGGLRINPNLYNSGKVCLSLLNTWSGAHTEMWVPGTSTMLQVLVSIQGLILNMKPYFNEPGFAPSTGSAYGEKASLQYNENTLILSLKTMVYTMNRPPKHFEDLVVGHFQHRVRDILMACKAYTEGVQVGCLAKGGVQDVDEGNNSCSPQFRHNVGSFIKTLIGAFKSIGAKEAEEFMNISVKEGSLPPAPTPTPIPIPPPFPSANVYSPLHFAPMPPYNQYW